MAPRHDVRPGPRKLESARSVRAHRGLNASEQRLADSPVSRDAGGHRGAVHTRACLLPAQEGAASDTHTRHTLRGAVAV